MTDLRAAAQQALEALDACSWEQVYATRGALRAALAEPVQPQTMTLQEVWDAAGGNSGIKPTKQDVLDALRLLDEVCDAADARLVAAAPCLLEALKLAVLQNEHDMVMTGEELRQCRAAIAKVERT